MKHLIAVAATIALALAVHAETLGAQRPPRPQTFDVVGVVRDEATGRPMAGVLIAADSAQLHRVVTDSGGAYRFTGLPRGTYFISARRLGYYVERREIRVACPVDVVNDRGKIVNDGGPCDPSPATLNFLLRPQTTR